MTILVINTADKVDKEVKTGVGGRHMLTDGLQADGHTDRQKQTETLHTDRHTEREERAQYHILWVGRLTG